MFRLASALGVVLLACFSLVYVSCYDGPSSNNFDFTDPVTTLTAPLGGETLAGMANITWTTVDANPDTVELLLSTDSGASYSMIVAAAAPDTGTFSWNTTSVADSPSLRIRITPTDRIGHVGEWHESLADFGRHRSRNRPAPKRSLLLNGGKWTR